MRIIITLAVSLACVFAQNDCLYAALAWESMGGNPTQTPNRNSGACCDTYGIDCGWTLEYLIPRNRITSVIWSRRGLAGIVPTYLFQLMALRDL